MIRHSVVFKLRQDIRFEEKKAFLDAASKLETIPNVLQFECLRQVSEKNHFTFGIFMKFHGLDDYSSYNVHPDHIAFIENFWKPHVEDFLEFDFEPIT